MSADARKRGSNAKRRRGARQKAMQALYQWDFDRAANQTEQVISQFTELQNMEKVDVDYFEALFSYAVENIADIDAAISPHLDRELDRLDPIERSVLRICCTELKTELATPYKVVVNEAVEISKDFGADTGYRYINGIADKLAGALRSVEYRHDHPSGNARSTAPVERQSAHKMPSENVKISVKEKTSPESGKPAARRKDSSREGKAAAESKSTAAEKPDPAAGKKPDAGQLKKSS